MKPRDVVAIAIWGTGAVLIGLAAIDVVCDGFKLLVFYSVVTTVALAIALRFDE